MKTIITINFDNITDEVTWDRENCKYYSTEEDPVHPHTHKKKFIDITKIPNNLIADWLQKNGDFICYEESNETIENTHEIPRVHAHNTINFVGIRWEDLQNKMISLGINNYDSYVIIDVDQLNNKLNFTKTLKHDTTKNNFSFPFLKSVAVVNKLNNNDLYMFGETISNQLILKIKDVKYYDITDYPYSLKIKK